MKSPTRRTPVHIVAALSFIACAVHAPAAHAQTTKTIGNTSAGTPVYLETKSVSIANGITTATLRVALAPPIKTADGDMVLLRSVAMIDCTKRQTATKERWFFFDAKGKREARHDKPGMPGYGSPIKGSLADVAITHFCTKSATTK
ncbi:MAG: hypothetical protein IT353_08595 [Gemmatimonadaceae bacterium]|nr:hypothetical protein [Gemmatimonadaceae bacterium]